MPSNESRIYVGNLPPDIRTKDIEDLFYKYGKIVFIDLKNRRGPPFSFVEFEDPRDADDAVYARDGYDYDGYKLRVEFPRGGGGSFRGSRSGTSSGAGRSGGGGRGPPARRSQYRVTVTGEFFVLMQYQITIRILKVRPFIIVQKCIKLLSSICFLNT